MAFEGTSVGPTKYFPHNTKTKGLLRVSDTQHVTPVDRVPAAPRTWRCAGDSDQPEQRRLTFLRGLADRTVLVVGDSHAQQLWCALVCFALQSDDVSARLLPSRHPHLAQALELRHGGSASIWPVTWGAALVAPSLSAERIPCSVAHQLRRLDPSWNVDSKLLVLLNPCGAHHFDEWARLRREFPDVLRHDLPAAALARSRPSRPRWWHAAVAGCGPTTLLQTMARLRWTTRLRRACAVCSERATSTTASPSARARAGGACGARAERHCRRSAAARRSPRDAADPLPAARAAERSAVGLRRLRLRRGARVCAPRRRLATPTRCRRSSLAGCTPRCTAAATASARSRCARCTRR